MELQKYEIEHLKLLEEIASECALFLKREDLAFPISEPTKIDLFGNGVRYLVKGGTGSGDVDVREFLNVEQAFEQAGFEVTSKDWLSQYDEIRKEAKKELEHTNNKITISNDNSDDKFATINETVKYF